MPSIRIWTLESDNDAKAVKSLADKLVSHLKLENLTIQTTGRRALPRYGRRGGSQSSLLGKAVENYLKQDACVIFVIDNDGPMSSHQRRQEPNSLFNQVAGVVQDKEFRGRVFFAPAVQELEAWLLIDCVGIFAFFARQRPLHRGLRRQQVTEKDSFFRLVNRYQKGDTELIVESESGGRGPKEYLMEFAQRILLELNPNMSRKNLRDNRYREGMAPEVAKQVVIDRETLQRNNSLRYLGEILANLG